MKTNSLLLVFLVLSLVAGCEVDKGDEERGWQGLEKEFEDDFRMLASDDSDDPILLIDRESNAPFTGDVERVSEQAITKQKYLKGKLDGKSVKSSSDGSFVEANYLGGKLHGPMIFYDSAGKERTRMVYLDGKLVPEGANSSKK